MRRQGWSKPSARHEVADESPVSETLRLIEILTTASAIANFGGTPDVDATHMLDAIAVLQGEKGIGDFGRPVSPLVPRGKAGADPAVKEIARRWFTALGGHIEASLTAGQLDELQAELVALGRAEASTERH